MIPASEILTKHKQWLSAVAASPASARKASTDALDGCLAALKQIEINLRDLQYPVEQIIIPCTDIEQASKLLRKGTSFTPPLVLAKFWQQIGGVSLVDINDYAHCEFWKMHGMTAPYCDGLHIDACNRDWVDFVASDYAEQKEDEESFDKASFYFQLSPDGYHKDNISGGLSYGLALGGGWVSLWKNFEWTNSPASSHSQLDFLAYLRTAILECAGFPGLYGDPAFEPIRQRLLKDVMLF